MHILKEAEVDFRFHNPDPIENEKIYTGHIFCLNNDSDTFGCIIEDGMGRLSVVAELLQQNSNIKYVIKIDRYGYAEELIEQLLSEV